MTLHEGICSEACKAGRPPKRFRGPRARKQTFCQWYRSRYQQVNNLCGQDLVWGRLFNSLNNEEILWTT